MKERSNGDLVYEERLNMPTIKEVIKALESSQSKSEAGKKLDITRQGVDTHLNTHRLKVVKRLKVIKK